MSVAPKNVWLEFDDCIKGTKGIPAINALLGDKKTWDCINQGNKKLGWGPRESELQKAQKAIKGKKSTVQKVAEKKDLGPTPKSSGVENITQKVTRGEYGQRGGKSTDPIDKPESEKQDPGKNKASGCPNCTAGDFVCGINKQLCEIGHGASGLGGIVPIAVMGLAIVLILQVVK